LFSSFAPFTAATMGSSSRAACAMAAD